MGTKTKIYVIQSVAQQIRQEMTSICSLRQPSLLRHLHDAVNNFNWQAIITEFSQKLPTIMFLLKKYCQNWMISLFHLLFHYLSRNDANTCL